MGKKFALIHLGNDENYGLVFVAGELLKQEQAIRWFDGDLDGVISEICVWEPDFVCFSPLTTTFDYAVKLAEKIKEKCPKVKTVFGGHHVYAVQNVSKERGIDIVVIGPAYGIIDKIINNNNKETITGTPTFPENMFPAREEYFESISRIANRHRKYIMSHFGCIYNCSYCSTSLVRKRVGAENYKRCWLVRRPVNHLIEESKILLKYNTKEISLEDDDILAGNDAEAWLADFSKAWEKEIGLSIYANVTPLTVLQSSDKTLKILAGLAKSVQMGLQTCRPGSLKLFNRQFQNEEQVKKAYDRLSSFNIKVKLELIIGLPVEDPIGDAIDTIKMAQRIGPGTFVACFPLMLYPGTVLYDKCLANGILLNESCNYEWHDGCGSVKFDLTTAKQIRNLTKMATMFCRYNIDEQWMRALVKMDINDISSKNLSECQYYESLIFRHGDEVRDEFDEILASMNFKY
ncbi:MAG: cobalamin-dependent protein [Victivallaceae bacterium]|nr:cobalamin-dependent protein [Victivallaceae bacterium]